MVPPSAKAGLVSRKCGVVVGDRTPGIQDVVEPMEPGWEAACLAADRRQPARGWPRSGVIRRNSLDGGSPRPVADGPA
jgi:hypothetical protein